MAPYRPKPRNRPRLLPALEEDLRARWTSNDPDALLTVLETAIVVGRSQSALRIDVHQGRIPATHTEHGRIRLRAEDVRAVYQQDLERRRSRDPDDPWI